MKRMLNHPFRIAGVVSLIVFGAGLSFAAPTTQPSLNDFNVLSDRNMFLRDRPRPKVYEPKHRDSDRHTENFNTPEAIERYTVLRGVVIEDNELHAYVENTHSGNAQRLVVGDSIGGGRVSDIAIDAIAFEADGRQSWVEIGQNLQGARIAAEVSTTGPSTMPTDTANLSVLERMKLRRQQEHSH